MVALGAILLLTLTDAMDLLRIDPRIPGDLPRHHSSSSPWHSTSFRNGGRRSPRSSSTAFGLAVYDEPPGFGSTSGGDNPPCHVVGHATAAQRYQAVARGTKKESSSSVAGSGKTSPRAGALDGVSLPIYRRLERRSL